MTGAFSFFKLSQVRPPVRRVLALDAGSRCLKLLLAESDFGRLRILKEELMDLQAEGLVSADETKAHLRATMDNWGRPPLALVLPQHLSLSQVVELPLAPQNEVEKLIHNETLKLSGVSETRIVYDFVRTETSSTNHQQFWVTLSQEGDIRERIVGLGLEPDDLCDVTTTANALIAAFRATSPLSARSILVHVGAQTTVIVVLLAGQGAFATSFQMGGDFFTRSLARLRNCPEQTAESLKRDYNLLTGADAGPEFAGIVDGWAAELKRQVTDWLDDNPNVGPEGAKGSIVERLQGFELVASGGAFEQPGLLEYLKSTAGLNLRRWPKGNQPEMMFPSKGFEVSFGAALQALGYSAQPVSLLPDDYRQAWHKRLSRQRIEFASLALIVIGVLVLALGTWHKTSLLTRKTDFLNKIQAGREAVMANNLLTADLVSEYETLRPVFQRQQNTSDTLKTLALLQQTRSNRSFWYVAVADQSTYFNQPLTLASTNRPARTNLMATISDRANASMPVFPAISTNSSPAKSGLIAELCVPAEAETSRTVLSQLVNELKEQRLFSKVDLLSEDLRRVVADPKVIIADRHYVLSLDFAGTDFQQPLALRKGLPALPQRGNPKRPNRASSWALPEAPTRAPAP
jgi:hypothetical protein